MFILIIIEHPVKYQGTKKALYFKEINLTKTAKFYLILTIFEYWWFFNYN